MSERARVLPLAIDLDAYLVCAKVHRDGHIEHLEVPEYHGKSNRPERSPGFPPFRPGAT